MTRAQANALSQALAARHVGHEIAFAYDGTGAESANVELTAGIPYGGPDLAALAQYCAANGLVLSIVPSSMGVV